MATIIRTDAEVLTSIEVAGICEVDVGTVNRWTLAGKLLSVARTPTGYRRYAVAEVARFLTERGWL
jgi:DNA-binding transcriptional MerR regulator